MRTLKLLSTGLVAIAVIALLIGCGGDQSQPEPTTQEQSQSATETQTAEATSAKAYPLDYCIVSGEKLGSMGDPVVKTYQGRQVKFCCQMCVPDFESNVAMYMAKIDSAAAGTTDMPGHEGHDHDHSGHDHSHGG